MPNKAKKIQLVRYCPGDSVGSPALMPLVEAERYLNQDLKLLEKLQRVDSIKKPVHLPHIGGYCDKCKCT